jgi:hypothetical protein
MIDHTGVSVSDVAASKAFHPAALAGLGHARLREAHDRPNDHGAFVHDPDGHNIEAVCHDAEDPS